MASLTGQSCAHLQIIAVDDGSTDTTPAILADWAARDQRIEIVTQHNQGLGAARNAGIALVRGKYLSFVDSDDYLAPMAVDNLLREAEASGSDIVIGARQKFNARGSQLSPGELFAAPLSGVKLADHSEIFQLVAVHGKLFRTTFFFKHHLSFQVLRAQEDASFTYMAYSRARKFSVITEDTYFYRKREAGDPSITQGRLRAKNLIGRMVQIESTLSLAIDGGGRQLKRRNPYRTEFSSRLLRHLVPLASAAPGAERDEALELLSDFAKLYHDEVRRNCNADTIRIFDALEAKDIAKVEVAVAARAR